MQKTIAVFENRQLPEGKALLCVLNAGGDTGLDRFPA